jgi:hypothetical protein
MRATEIYISLIFFQLVVLLNIYLIHRRLKKLESR